MEKKRVEHHLHDIRELIDYLRNDEVVYIQVHDFPDPDAVASAFGLQTFFNHFNITSRIVYDTIVQRNALKKMITDLEIELVHINDSFMHQQDKIILVDGCKGNANMTDLIGDEVGVIDHHESKCPDDVEFCDIRTHYGACATIIATYFLDQNIPIPKDVATAFMIGIATDTHMLKRGVSSRDMEVYYRCHSLADSKYVARLLSNNIEMSDLSYFRHVIENLQHASRFGFCYLGQGCDQNLLGILANFVLSIDEIDFVVLCARNESGIHFSLRNENPNLNAVDIIRTMVSGIGFGGGHADMAGGVVENVDDFDATACFDQLTSYNELLQCELP